MPTVMSCLKQAWSSQLLGCRVAENPACPGALSAEQLLLRKPPLRLLGASGGAEGNSGAVAPARPALLALLLFSSAAEAGAEPLTRQPRCRCQPAGAWPSAGPTREHLAGGVHGCAVTGCCDLALSQDGSCCGDEPAG